MKPFPLFLAVAALAVTACGSDVTSPAETSVNGTYAGSETGVFQPATNTVLLTVLGSGNASVLGNFTSESDFVLDVASGTTVGTVTVTAADGSTITTNATGVGLATNGISQIVEKATITGGTKQFAGASGELQIARTLNQGTGQSSGTITGTIHRR